MCNINGCPLKKGEIIQVKNIKRELLHLVQPAWSGFNYRDWPILKPNIEKTGFDIEMSHWEYIPWTIQDHEELKAARKEFTWLNARSENLFVNEKGKLSMYREGAIHGRCLVLSGGFFEHQHRIKIGKRGKPLKDPDKIPYRIGAGDKPYFFMAGVSRKWTNHLLGGSADTFAIVTTAANELMSAVHNSKKRMPTILNEELAYEWLYGDLKKERILEIAATQFPSNQMWSYTVARDFLDPDNPDPLKEVDHLDTIIPDEKQFEVLLRGELA